jgi:hypothetical protein
MAYFLYAKMAVNGDLERIVRTADKPLSAEQQANDGVVPYVEEGPTTYDPETHKHDGRKVTVIAGVATSQDVIVAKTDAEKHQDKLDMRRAVLPDAMERLELTNSLLLRVVKWINLQQDPSKLETHFDLDATEIEALSSIQATLESVALPTTTRRVVEPKKKL